MLVRKSPDCFTYADEDSDIRDDLTPLKEASTSFSEQSDNYVPTDGELTINSTASGSLYDDQTTTTAAATTATPTAKVGNTINSPRTAQRNRVIFSPSPQPNMAKHIINRQLRKFASEANFAVVHETSGGATSESETLPQKSPRVFTTRPNVCCNRINGGGTLFGRLVRSRKTSEESGSFGSDATVASGSVTPVSGHRMTTLRRPKSAGQMVHFSSEMNTSATSATTQSFESLQQLAAPAAKHDDRRPSNIYIDEDSAHEFDYEDGYAVWVIRKSYDV